MCRGRYRRAGVTKDKAVPLFGAEGLALVEYIGEKEGQLTKSIWTNVHYPYYPDRQFYVDVRDLSRVLAWKENGAHVFVNVDGGMNASAGL